MARTAAQYQRESSVIVLTIWAVLAVAVIASTLVNASYWSGATILLALLFGAADLLKPFFAASGTRAGLALASLAALLSVWASSQFFTAGIAGDLIRLEAVKAEIATLEAEPDTEPAAAEAPQAAALARVRAVLASKEADAATASADADRAREAERQAVEARDAPNACDSGRHRPNAANPRCQTKTAEAGAATRAREAAEAALRRAAAAVVAARSDVAAAQSLADIEARERAAASGDDRAAAERAEARLIALRAERTRIEAENAGLIKIAIEFGITPAALVLWLSRLGAVVAELIVTFGPAIIAHKYGAPVVPAGVKRLIKRRATKVRTKATATDEASTDIQRIDGDPNGIADDIKRAIVKEAMDAKARGVAFAKFAAAKGIPVTTLQYWRSKFVAPTNGVTEAAA